MTALNDLVAADLKLAAASVAQVNARAARNTAARDAITAGATYTDVGRVLGVTRQRAAQIVAGQ